MSATPITFPNKQIFRRRSRRGLAPGAWVLVNSKLTNIVNLIVGCLCLLVSCSLLADENTAKANFDTKNLNFDEIVVIKRHEINPSHVYSYHKEGFSPGGGLYAYNLKTKTLRELVNSAEGQINDCNISYDGKQILFSWKKSPKEEFQVYRINVDGSGLLCLTDTSSSNINPCWLPDGGFAFLSDRKPAYAYCMTSTVPILYRADKDGKKVNKLSSNYLNDFTPSVMDDGKIIYSRWEYVDRPAIPIQSLWTINQDGTNVSGYFGNRVLSPATFMEARSIPGTKNVICTMTAHNGPCRGAIGIIDPSKGSNSQASIRNVTPDVDIGLVDKGSGNRVRGPYENPYPLDAEFFLVSKRGDILLKDYDNELTVELLVKDAQDVMGYYSPMPIRAREKPPVQASLLPQNPSKGWATMILQDVYYGLGKDVVKGSIDSICVVQEIEKNKFADNKYRAFGFQFPVVSCGATYAPKKIWGYAKVDEDGSARFKVPADVPVYFMAIDKDGRAVQRMRTFTHLKSGEVQSCVGCHSDRNLSTPINKRRILALSKKTQELIKPAWGVKGFSYPRIVQPVLDEHCVRCHNATSAPKGVDLSADKTDFFNVSYEILARKDTATTDFRIGGVRRSTGAAENPFTSWITTMNGAELNILNIKPKAWGSHASLLSELIMSGHKDKDGNARVAMDKKSQKRIFTWIDLNVPYYGTSESNYPTKIGCRRLYPETLTQVLDDVRTRRCADCHQTELPLKFWTRIENPELNNFLMAPLSKDAGGSGSCGKAVFKNTTDPDYQKILKCFDSVEKLMKENPRKDMEE